MVGITHAAVVVVADDGTSPVGSDEWNAAHSVDAVAPSGLTGATGATRYVGGTASGAPTTGTFSTGDWVVAQDGKVWVCTSGGSPGTWSATGSGGATLGDGKPYIWTPPGSPTAYDDEFNDATGMSGPVNGLNARWTKKNLGTSSWVKLDDTYAPGCLALVIPTGQTLAQGIYQAVPSGDFAFEICMAMRPRNREQWSPFIVDSSGTGVCLRWDSQDGNLYTEPLTAWSKGSFDNLYGFERGWDSAACLGALVRLRIRKAGNDFYMGGSTNPRIIDVPESNRVQTMTFTAAYMGVLRTYDSGGYTNELYIDYFRRVA